MKIKTKLILLLIFLGLFPILIVVIGNYLNNNRKIAYRNNLLIQKKYATHVAIQLAGEAYKSIEETYTYWDEFVIMGVQKKDRAWNDANLYPIVALQGSDHIWACDLKLNVAYYCYDSTKFDLPLPISLHEITQHIDTVENSTKRYFEFFTTYNDKIIQVFCITIHGSTDATRMKKPAGFFITTNILDSTYLAELKTITANSIEITDDTLPKNKTAESQFVIYEPLIDFSGKTIKYLKFSSKDSFEAKENQLNTITIVVFVFLLILVIIISFFYIKRLVSNPLTDIIQTLNTVNINHIQLLRNQKNEFGKLSGLIVDSFKQNEEIKEANIVLGERIEEINQQNEELKAVTENMETNFNELSLINEQLLTANEEISLKGNKINNSIQYALRIQNAVFTSVQNLTEVYPNNFVIFKPKEIVSGDFYFFKKINDIFIVAVADCAAHGISGAFMSILSIALLHEIVFTREITQADQVLNTLRSELNKSLGQSKKHSNLNEDIDIAFCAIDLMSYKMQFAGSNLSVHIAQNNSANNTQNNILTIEGNKMSINAHSKADMSFTNHTIQIQKNDMLYLFTDGYESQLGGEYADKFGEKRLFETLSEIGNQNIEKQNNILENIYTQWTAENEQTDDVLIVGFKIN